MQSVLLAYLITHLFDGEQQICYSQTSEQLMGGNFALLFITPGQCVL